MTFLSAATSSQGDIFKLKKDQLRDLRVPDLDSIDHSKWKAQFAAFRNQPLGTYREQFTAAASQTGVRYALDQFISAELNLPPLTPALYELVAAEPMVSRDRL